MLDRICTAIWELDPALFFADTARATTTLRVLPRSALISCNRSAHEMMERLAMLTQACDAEMVVPMDGSAMASAVQARLAGRAGFEHDVRIAFGDEVAWFHLSLSFPASGEPLAPIVMSVIEISRYRREETDLSLARRRLEQASRDMNMAHLARSVTDAVSQPLTSILFSGRAALTRLSESDHECADLRADIERMLIAASRSADMIRQARDFAEKRENERETVTVADVVAHVLTQIEGELSRRGLTLHVDIADIPQVTADRIELQQVVLNLLLNAMDAHQDAGQFAPIRLSAGMGDDAQVVVSIADEGNGIAPDIADRIFEPLFTTKSGNVGVGLAVCRNIVEAHGGEIRVSTSQGPGTTVTFTLPVREWPKAHHKSDGDARPTGRASLHGELLQSQRTRPVASS